MDETTNRFLLAAVAVEKEEGVVIPISMCKVGAQIGIADRVALKELTEELIVGGYLRQDPGTNEVGWFRLTDRARSIVSRRRIG